jgi:Carboxypeptidase regulatory-like domain
VWLVTLVVAALALALPAVGEAAGPGGIAGTVTAEGGAELAGVQVCAEERGGLEEFGCDETDSLGGYEITGLAAGEYIVVFRPSSELNYVRQFYDGAPTELTALPVTVGVGLTSGIDAELAKGAKISGTVTASATGLPAANVFVCAYSTDFASVGCSETNAFGAYVIQGLAAGSYEVEFFPTEAKQNLVGANYPGLVTVPAGGERPGVNIALQTGGQIGGTVRLAATGTPLKGVEVCLTEAGESWPLACLKSPASGAYRFTGLWTGVYKVVFSPEASELEEGEYWEIPTAAYPAQWWNGQSTFAAATPIGVTAGTTIGGIDGSLGPGPVVSPPAGTPSSPPAATVVPKPKRLKCKRTFVKKKVKGKARCVKRHKAKRHRGKHHPKPRKHGSRS